MPEKDPTNYTLITYLWVAILSMWGGAVNFFNKLKSGSARPFNIVEFIGELFTSAFVGIVTFLLCEWANIPPLLSAALIAISGHMGSRALFQLELWAEHQFINKFGLQPPPRTRRSDIEKHAQDVREARKNPPTQ